MFNNTGRVYMLVIWNLIAQASGKMNGVVAARNQGGNYVREWANPVDPQTTRQVNCRDTMAVLWEEWTAMSQADRDAWETYARTQTTTGRLAVKRNLHGWTQFCRQNYNYVQAREQLGFNWVTGTSVPIHPQPFNIPPYLSWGTAYAKVELTWDVTKWPAADDHTGIMVYISSPRAPTINFFKGPYYLLDAISGNPDTPPTPPIEFDLPSIPASGQKLFYRLLFVSQDHIRGSDWLGVLQRP